MPASYWGDPNNVPWGAPPQNQPPPTQWSQAYNLALLGALPSAMESQVGLAQLGQQYRANDANFNLQNRYNQQDIGFANQDYNLAMQGVANSRNALTQNQAADYRDYQTSAKGLGIDYGQYARQAALQPKLFGLNEADIKRESERAIQNLTSDATARGALGSEGYRQGLDYQKSELADALAGNTLKRDETMAGVDDQYKQYQVNFEKLNNSLRRGNEGAQQQQQALNLQAQRLGLSNQQAVAGINRAIEQLGISHQTNAQQIALEMAKLDAGLQTRFPAEILQLVQKIVGG